MAYYMRFRCKAYLIHPQVNDAADPLAEGDNILFDVGDYTPVPVGPVFYSIGQLANKAFSINNRFQSGLHVNVRFEIFGKPVGAPENGAPDLTDDQKLERRYVLGDTPNPALLIAIRKANHKAVAGLGVKPQFAPADNIPEQYQADDVVANP